MLQRSIILLGNHNLHPKSSSIAKYLQKIKTIIPTVPKE
ncbi:MAG: hypothetical protein ACI9DJ_003460 [Algoriphagus sp.]|jgi:hypothetical protein